MPTTPLSTGGRPRRAVPTSRRLLAAGTVVPVLAAVFGGVAASSSSAAEPNLVVNPGFESGTTGWRVTGDAKGKLALTSAARSGRAAVTVSSSATATTVLNDATNTVRSTVAGATYVASAWVRGSVPGMTLQIRQAERSKSGTAGSDTTRVVLPNTGWHQITSRYVAETSGGNIDVNVLVYALPRGQSFTVDDVGVYMTAPVPTTSPTTPPPSPTATPTVAPTTPPPTTAPTTPPPTTTPPPAVTMAAFDQRGIPTGDAVLFGAAIGGNTDPAAREAQMGDKLGVRRTYYGPTQVSSAVSTAKADLAAGRLPWISFKLPASWADMANGSGDAWAKDLSAKLGALDGPVWVALHHEPENDGPIADWTRMQKRMSPIFKAQPNVAFTIIVTGWHQFYSSSSTYRLDNIWPGDGLVDVVGIDPYNEYGVTKNGVLNTKLPMLELEAYYAKLAPWAAAHGTRWAVAETGYTHAAAQIDGAWLTRAYDDMRAYDGIALAYFDSALNPIGDSTWPLETQPKQQAFSAVLKRSEHLGD